MKIKRLIIPLLLIAAFCLPSCNNKQAFVDPVYVFMKWSSAVKKLNYKEYAECEAFPKDEIVFRELYDDFYYSDLLIRELGKYDENDVRTDVDGYKHNHRKVFFECRRIERKTGRAIQQMKGDIEFISYINGPKVNRGWLMYNRTIISTGMSIRK